MVAFMAMPIVGHNIGLPFLPVAHGRLENGLKTVVAVLALKLSSAKLGLGQL